MISSLSESVILPSGLVLPNRLVKSALAEGLAPTNEPNADFYRAYGEWGSGGWGAVMTGNIMVDERYGGSPGDLILKQNPPFEKYKKLAAAMKARGSPAIAQINHPGRQAMYGAGGSRTFRDKAIGPSPIPLNIGDSLLAKALAAIIFGTPRQMTTDDIKNVVRQFADASKFLSDAGFDGIELHGAHGYLIAQFLSQKSNQRTDSYGGSPANRARFVVEVITAIRKAVPKTFAVGIKLNSADASQAGSLEDTIEQMKLISDAGVDFLEISGGSYENPEMMQANDDRLKSTRSSAREAFFLDFAKALRAKFPDIILMVTGGFRTRIGMEAAVAEGACDIIGLGRPSTVNPHWPKDVILNERIPDQDAQLLLNAVPVHWLLSKLGLRIVGAGAEGAHYGVQIHRLAKGLTPFAPGESPPVEAKA